MFLGGKGGRCIGLTTLPPCADCLEIWKSQPPETLRACPGLSWDCFTYGIVSTFSRSRIFAQLNVKVRYSIPAVGRWIASLDSDRLTANKKNIWNRYGPQFSVRNTTHL
jgi:hypothetical protein